MNKNRLAREQQETLKERNEIRTSEAMGRGISTSERTRTTYRATI